ncbi:hypothetical protein JTF06_12095 [Desemzia sp. RIT804]|nr:hypothetical protein [Desemzia sp. RIT 804]MBM6615627.1 hypothetical protein [Desemzia sp. RIT 804]
MRYKNNKTGAVVDSSSIIKGENWELIEEKKQDKKPAPKKEPRKTKE